jgi:acyl-CoA synthetase (NDP forming)
VEGLKNPRRVRQAAARAETPGKPILMVKTGRTPDGERAARSHTASLAGSYAVLEAA